jgi:hypothetical protein
VQEAVFLGEERYELRNNCGKCVATLTGTAFQGTVATDDCSVAPSLYAVTLDAKYEFTFSLNIYVYMPIGDKNALKT